MLKFTIDQQTLNNALQLLQTVVPHRSPLPVLQNVRIQANKEGIFCTATNLEIATRIQVEGNIEEEGDVIINCKKLASLVRVLPQTEILFNSTATDRITLTSKSGRYKLIGMSSEEFPIIPECEGNSFTIEGYKLAQLIENTAFAASTEEVRYVLNGIYFNFVEDYLEVVATDGKKLSITKLQDISGQVINNESEAESTEPPKLESFLLPLNASHEIKKAFLNSESVQIVITKNRLLLTDGQITLVCRLLEADYPNYKQIFSQDQTGYATLDTKDLLDSIRRVSMLSSNQNYRIEMEFLEGENQVRVFAQTPEYGEGEEFVDVTEQEGSLHIGLHSQFVIQVLSQISEPSVKLSFSEAEKPMIFEPSEEKDQLCLVMPMKLG